MGSLGDSISALDYLRSRSDVDCDCLDTDLAGKIGRFVDCTSNQADAYLELSSSQHSAVLKDSIETARSWQHEHPKVPLKELAFEIGMIKLSLAMVPSISGSIHVMSNPLLADSSSEIVENSRRIVNLCHRLDPHFDMSRLCIKVVATWEGLQACVELKRLGIRTLATTLFTFEQAVLAAEVGCDYIAPFLHELQAFFDNTYKDNEPCFGLIHDIQRHYEGQKSTTVVKAAGLLSVEHAIKLAGVQSVTIATDVLEELSQTRQRRVDMEQESLFQETSAGSANGTLSPPSYMRDEAKWREAFAKSDGGKGQLKTRKAIEIFCEYQLKGEELIERSA